MKITIYIIATMFLFLSCNQSTKGNWTEEDKAKARTQWEVGKTNIEAGGIDFELFVSCVIERSEQNYDSYIEAMKDKTGLEAIGTECAKELLGNSKNTASKWSILDMKKLEKGLHLIRDEVGKSGPKIDAYFECYREKMIAAYDSFNHMDSDPEGCAIIGIECVDATNSQAKNTSKP